MQKASTAHYNPAWLMLGGAEPQLTGPNSPVVQIATGVETHLRKPSRRYVDRADLVQRRWSRLQVVRPLRLLPLYGRYLAQVGATAEVTHGPADRYDLPRRWSSAIQAAGFDGIEYRSRHDDDQLCVALFDRGDPPVVPSGPPTGWLSDSAALGRILDRYAIELG